MSDISIRKVATLLGVSRNKVRDLIKNGRLHAFMDEGKRWRVTEESVDNLLLEVDEPKKHSDEHSQERDRNT